MFHTINLTNFRHFKNLKLELGSGLCCILGENGTGKSTIIEALTFMMYGSKYMRGKVSSSINSKTKIEIGGDFPQEFTLTRYGNQTELHIQGSILQRTAEIKEYFETSFCSAETFTTVFVAAQRIVSEIAILRPTERKRRLCELLGLVAVERVSEVLRNRIRGLQKPIVSEPKVDQSLEDLSFLKGIDPGKMMKVRELQKELKAIQSLVISPVQASEKLRELSPLIKELQEVVGNVSGERLFKHDAVSRAKHSGTCLLCGTKMEGSSLQAHLEKDIQQLDREVIGLNQKINPLLQMESSYQQAASYRSSETVLRDLGADIDINVDDLWPKIVEGNRQKGHYELLKSQWEEFKSHQGDLELGLHFQDFLPYIMSEKFRRLEELVTGYLREYSPFQEFRMDEQGNMFVDDKPLRDLSAGQCDLTCIIFRVALAQLFGEEKFGRAPIVIFDSSFDSIDPIKMATGLELLADSPFDQTIVTAHNEETARRLGLNITILE